MIYNEDCLEGMKKLADSSIDLIATDPPYCVGASSNGLKSSFSDFNLMRPFWEQCFGGGERDIWRIKNAPTFSLKARNHPSEKSVELMEKMILNSSAEGDTVLDSFMGSGSTGVACVNTNRQFIGYELDEKFFKTAERRIEEALAKKRQELF